MADSATKSSKDGALTYVYLLIYIALSSGQIFFNKMGICGIRESAAFRCSERPKKPLLALLQGLKKLGFMKSYP
ncbi:hypothetical protein RDABS01_031829 [Bienertia sinuspersici]